MNFEMNDKSYYFVFPLEANLLAGFLLCDFQDKCSKGYYTMKKCMHSFIKNVYMFMCLYTKTVLTTAKPDAKGETILEKWMFKIRLQDVGKTKQKHNEENEMQVNVTISVARRKVC